MAKESWGQWGAEDERGAVNRLSEERVLAAGRLVRQGKVFSLGMPLGPDTATQDFRMPLGHFMNRDGGDYAAGGKRPGGLQFADDTVVMSAHFGTHIDALAHVWYDDQLYNGFPGNSVRSTTGAQRCGIDKMGPVVGRGVLLDMARHFNTPVLEAGRELTGADLAECARRQGVEIGEGDIVLLRTGWLRMASKTAEYFHREPGPGLDAARWLADRKVAATGADNPAFEVLPSAPGAMLPVHQILIRDHGIPLMEQLSLDSLAEAERYEFLFVATPLPIVGGTASPIHPIAIV